jgi:FAD/FMN-containing dehydrogenase
VDLTGVDPTEAERAVAEVVASATRVDPVGAGTHREVGGPPPEDATAVRAPVGLVSYEPADLTVCVGAGTTVDDLDRLLAPANQECALDPRERRATVGGTLAAGLSGIRRLGVGPLRDQVLEVRFATADGRLVRGGGPTVKNVTGYDLPRLLVGSLGTLGVLTRVVLRCRPRPETSQWLSAVDDHGRMPAVFRPASVLWDGASTWVQLEGRAADVAGQARRAGLAPTAAPALPIGAHRGRIGVPVANLVEVGRALTRLDQVRWLAELGVGTVHVACDDPVGLAEARAIAGAQGGWLLREAGAPELDGFGGALPNVELMARIKDAFDPDDKLAPGRLPLALSTSTRG